MLGMIELRSAMDVLRLTSRPEAERCVMCFALLVVAGVLLGVDTPLSLNVRISCLGGVAYLLLQALQPMVDRKLSKKCEEAMGEAPPTTAGVSKAVKKKKASKGKSQAPREAPAAASTDALPEPSTTTTKGQATPTAENHAAELKNARVEKLLAKKAQRKAARKAGKDAAEAAKAAREPEQCFSPAEAEAEATRTGEAVVQPTEAQDSTPPDLGAQFATKQEGSSEGPNSLELLNGDAGTAGAAPSSASTPAAPEEALPPEESNGSGPDTTNWADVNEDGWYEMASVCGTAATDDEDSRYQQASLGANISAGREGLYQGSDLPLCPQVPGHFFWICDDRATTWTPEVFQAPSMLVDSEGGAVPVCMMMVVNPEMPQSVEFGAPEPLLWQQEQPHTECRYGSTASEYDNCWAWVKFGRCPRGAKCRWSHPPLY